MLEERKIFEAVSNSKFFPKIKEAYQDDERLYLVMELSKGCNLRKYMDGSKDSKLSEQETSKFSKMKKIVLTWNRVHCCMLNPIPGSNALPRLCS